ncbi:hypothetical protein K461DRAFT_59937 [Myriangium duriaei CBS 260.36]|uniref:Uncharacterized protein n=1 Tax=Myriangium duriaei CBS 260.36 TaxID=1168546 RepID=A0A9P4MC31_9PEZI|nr:hypothetical protein K461DRAFT_59937 [Myriangium duriaei CBS 260.36]
MHAVLSLGYDLSKSISVTYNARTSSSNSHRPLLSPRTWHNSIRLPRRLASPSRAQSTSSTIGALATALCLSHTLPSPISNSLRTQHDLPRDVDIKRQIRTGPKWSDVRCETGQLWIATIKISWASTRSFDGRVRREKKIIISD